MKTLKMRIVVALLVIGVLMAGVAKKSEAQYTTLSSTAILISSAANLEVLSVTIGTGSVSAAGDQYFVILDTVPLSNHPAVQSQQTLLGGTTLQGALYSRALFPKAQHVVPPIVVFTTSTVTNQSWQRLTRYDFRDGNGDGIPISNGLVVYQEGTDYGTMITVEWRRRSEFPGYRR